LLQQLSFSRDPLFLAGNNTSPKFGATASFLFITKLLRIHYLMESWGRRITKLCVAAHIKNALNISIAIGDAARQKLLVSKAV
jgi:hypothetical protein